MKKACVLLAEGFEEVEAVTPIDYLRRAGIEVRALGLGGRSVSGAHGITIMADAALGDQEAARTYDAIIVPGGMPGAAHLAESPDVVALIKRHFAAGLIVAAICAAPAVVLHGACGIMEGKRFTGFPGTEGQVEGGLPVNEKVVVEGNLITSKGAGTAGEFAVAIIKALLGEAAAEAMAERVLLRL